MSVLKRVLTDARSLIAVESRWTQWVFARRKDGEMVTSNHPEACMWCAFGAISRVADGPGEIEAARTQLRRAAGHLTVSYINDHGHHEDVMKLYDKAIRMCI